MASNIISRGERGLARRLRALAPTALALVAVGALSCQDALAPEVLPYSERRPFGLSLHPAVDTIAVGQTRRVYVNPYTLAAYRCTVYPSNYQDYGITITWSSTDSTVLSVLPDRGYTAMALGQAYYVGSMLAEDGDTICCDSVLVAILWQKVAGDSVFGTTSNGVRGAVSTGRAKAYAITERDTFHAASLSNLTEWSLTSTVSSYGHFSDLVLSPVDSLAVSARRPASHAAGSIENEGREGDCPLGSDFPDVSAPGQRPLTVALIP